MNLFVSVAFNNVFYPQTEGIAGGAKAAFILFSKQNAYKM